MLYWGDGTAGGTLGTMICGTIGNADVCTVQSAPEG